MRVTALTLVRNGALYLERCLRHLEEHGLAVAVIDHGSTDGTAELLERSRPHLVRDVLRVPYDGAFDLEKMLRLQLEQARQLDSDWFVRVDVDEIPQSDRPGETLAEAVKRVDAGGWEVVNFDEFVFVYESDDVSYRGTDYFEAMLSYYHYAPEPKRLMRAFRAGLPVDFVAHAGHSFPPGSVKLYHGSFPLRHYIALSRAHAEAKFLGRRFEPRNLARGWHSNRVNLDAGQFAAPPSHALSRLADAAAPLDASRPRAKHFWEWGSGAAGSPGGAVLGAVQKGQERRAAADHRTTAQRAATGPELIRLPVDYNASLMTASEAPSKPPEQSVPAAAIALVGAATLLFEILLTRIFSVTMWYHFAFVAISLALFGIAASGVAVSVAPRFFRPERSTAQIGGAAAALAVTAVASFLIDLRIPLVPFDVPGESGPSWRAYGYLLAKFVVLAVPFFFSGLAVALAFTHFPRRVHRTYFADLAGGGLGCLLLVPLLRGVSAPSAVIFVAALAFLSAALVWRHGGRERAAVAAASGVLASLLAMGLNERFGFVGVDRVKSYGVSEVQVAERPKLYERWHPVSRIAVHPFEFSGDPKDWFYARDKVVDFPPVLEVTNDGGARTFLYPEMDAEAGRRLFRHDVTDLVYSLTEQPEVLVVGVGGGKDVLSALAYEARHVVAVELNPLMIDVVQEEFAAFTGAPFDDPRVEVAIDEGRNYIASRPTRYDVIKISATDTWAAAAVGAYALTENYLYTVEALEAFLAHLKPGGYLSIVRWYPFESLRLAVMAEDVLRRSGVEDPAARVLMVRNEQTLNMIIKNGPFTADEVERVRSRALEAELVMLDGAPPPAGESPADPELEGRRYIDGVHRTALGGIEGAELAELTPFKLDPASDDRPFFFNPVGLGDVEARRYYAFAGYTFQHGRALSLLLGLLQVSTAVALVFVVAPFVLRSGRPWAGLAGGVRTAASFYFLMLGLGYLLIEIPMLQQFILFLGHPTYAVTVVLFSLLVSSGAGSLLADRLPVTGRWMDGGLFGALVAVLAACVLGLSGFLHAAIGLPFAVRVLVSVALLVPVGLLMGMPFPTGLRILHGRGAAGLVPWAWAVNGAASVVAPVLATTVAILWGFSRAFYLGILCYVAAGGLLWALRRNRRSEPEAVP